MQFQHLTSSGLDTIISAASARASHYVTQPSGIIERSPSSDDVEYRQAYQNVLNALNALPDGAIIELQALAWTGRGDNGGDLVENYDTSRMRFDSTTRKYLHDMPLETYLQAGLSRSGAVLRP
jgi:Protein of unknown function (DUF3775)